MSKVEQKLKKQVVFFIDKEKFESDEADLSARTLLVDFAKEEPTLTTLATKHGNELKKYGTDETVHIENGMKFVVLHNTPTTVS